MDSIPKEVFRFLISTTSRFTGQFESPNIQIDHAWPVAPPYPGIEEGPYSRNYYVLSIRIEEGEKTIIIPNYTFVGDLVCATLSILFGKRFDNHGFLVSHGDFYIPNLALGPPTSHFRAAPYSHQPRKDLGIPLELNRFASVAPLFTEEHRDDKSLSILFAAGRFYLRSLQLLDQQPEFAYLDLITCGEVLSNYYDYDLEEFLDDGTKRSFERIRTEMPNGHRIVCQLQGKMRQLKRGYTRTLLDLLTRSCADFFAVSECIPEYGRLKREKIDKRLAASYDLRSLFLHTGIRFGHLIHFDTNEVQVGKLETKNKKLGKAIDLAPTYFGMERIMRFCLLRFMHLHGVAIDPGLDDIESQI